MACRYLGESFQEGEPQGEGGRRSSRRPASLQTSEREGVQWEQLSGPTVRLLTFSLLPELLLLQEAKAVVARAEAEPSKETAGGPQGERVGQDR